MATEEMLRIFRRHTVVAILEVMSVIINYRKWHIQLKKILLLLKNTLARPPIYHRTYPEMPSVASPGSLVDITKHN